MPTKCGSCGKEVTALIATKDSRELVCTYCIMERQPPILTLGQSKDHSYFWWPKTRRYLNTITIKELEGCGWFLRRMTVRNQMEPSQFDFTYHLEFYGSTKCRAIESYHHWPIGLKRCGRLICELASIKTSYYA